MFGNRRLKSYKVWVSDREEGVAVSHGQGNSVTKKSIYLSPSIEYAAFPVYAQFFEIGNDHWAQMVVQCRVRPYLNGI